MKEVVLFGGSRFIGLHLQRLLVDAGYRLTVVNRGISIPPELYPVGIRRVYDDRNAFQNLDLIFDRVYDAVFDLSGYKAEHILPILKYAHSFKSYIFCSTSSVIRVPPPFPYDENSPCVQTEGTYGGDKRNAEILLNEASERKKFGLTVFRPQAIIGPWDGASVQATLQLLKDHGEIKISRKTVNARINMLDVRDFSQAMIFASQINRTGSHLYNIAGDDAVTILDMIDQCSKLVSGRPLISIVNNTKDSNLFWHEYDLVPDNSKVKNDICINFRSFKESIRDINDWMDKTKKINFRVRRKLAILRRRIFRI